MTWARSTLTGRAGRVHLDGQVEVFEIRANRAEGQVAKTVRTYTEAVAWFAGAHLIPRSSHTRCDAGEPHGMRTNQQVPHPEDLAQVWPDLSGDNRRPAPWRHCQARTVAGQITASFLSRRHLDPGLADSFQRAGPSSEGTQLSGPVAAGGPPCC